MRRALVAMTAFLAAVALTSGTASAGGWNHDYTDASGDVSYANIDIIEIKSHASGTDIILELTVRGVIETSFDASYHIEVFGEPQHGSVSYGNGGMKLIYYPDGGVNTTDVTIVGGNTMRGIIPIAHAGNASAFDIQGSAVHRFPGGAESDQALNIGGSNDTVSQILGMAVWLFLLVLLAPIIVIVAVVVIVLLMKRRAQSPPQMQQPRPPP